MSSGAVLEIPELLTHILSFLDDEEQLRNSRAVCRKWRAVCSNDLLVLPVRLKAAYTVGLRREESICDIFWKVLHAIHDTRLNDSTPWDLLDRMLDELLRISRSIVYTEVADMSTSINDFATKMAVAEGYEWCDRDRFRRTPLWSVMCHNYDFPEEEEEEGNASRKYMDLCIHEYVCAFVAVLVAHTYDRRKLRVVVTGDNFVRVCGSRAVAHVLEEVFRKGHLKSQEGIRVIQSQKSAAISRMKDVTADSLGLVNAGMMGLVTPDILASVDMVGRADFEIELASIHENPGRAAKYNLCIHLAARGLLMRPVYNACVYHASFNSAFCFSTPQFLMRSLFEPNELQNVDRSTEDQTQNAFGKQVAAHKKGEKLLVVDKVNATFDKPRPDEGRAIYLGM